MIYKMFGKVIKSKEYNDDQIAEIERAVDNNLLPAQMTYMMNPKLGWQEMEQIQNGFLAGLTTKQVALYAYDCFDSLQMEVIKEALINGLSEEQVKVFAKSKFDRNQMIEIKRGFENGLTMEQVEVYANPEFDMSQMGEIFKGFLDGLTMEQVKSYAKPEIKYVDMAKMRKELLFKNITDKVDFNEKQLKEIKAGLELLDEKEIKLYANPKYNNEQMRVIRQALEDELPLTEIEKFTNSKLSWEEMEDIKFNLDFYKSNKNQKKGKQ
jgi:hypothetical protein